MIHVLDLMTLYFNNLNHIKFTSISDLEGYFIFFKLLKYNALFN